MAARHHGGGISPELPAGLEKFSERRLAKLLGVSPAQLSRQKLMAQIPNNLLDRLQAAGRENRRGRHAVISSKQLAAIGRALSGGPLEVEAERCPHCGGLLKIRRRIPQHLVHVVTEWMQEQKLKADWS
jgi:hypothetical protein